MASGRFQHISAFLSVPLLPRTSPTTHLTPSAHRPSALPTGYFLSIVVMFPPHTVTFEAWMTGPVVTTLPHQDPHGYGNANQQTPIAAAALADPQALWLQPLMTTPPAELFLEQLAPPQSFAEYVNDFTDNELTALGLELTTLDETAQRQMMLAVEALVGAEARVARVQRAMRRKTRGTREVKRETAVSKEILRTKQAARWKKKKESRAIRRAQRARESASGVPVADRK
ncbi:hypothetical protein C8T65DRAFT_648565 [Cerioporus squamosus]|nr:hypothetical protein C8T65DRAFT_648565 [Cerioporus squamosus]